MFSQQIEPGQFETQWMQPQHFEQQQMEPQEIDPQDQSQVEPVRDFQQINKLHTNQIDCLTPPIHLMN